DAAFWEKCAAAFRENPMVIFDAREESFVDTLRAAGARQVIAVDGVPKQPRDPNLIVTVHPKITAEASDEERHANFGRLAVKYPLLATDWTIGFDANTRECRALPEDPED